MRKSPLSGVHRRAKRKAQSQLRIGRDFVLALMLLFLGVALPFVSAATDRRIAALARRTLISSVQSDVSAASTRYAVPTNTPAPINLDTTPAVIATLVPIEPTVAIAPVANTELSALNAPAPILMYHYIRTVDETVDPLGYQLSVTPDLFAAHMAWMAQNGYTGVRVDTLIRCLQGEPICPPHPVAISFDDGYDDAATTALPILQQYGFRATFYIVTGFVGQPAYMNWDQIRQLRDTGMEIGAHTVDHQVLTRLDISEMQRQIVQSKQVLEQTLGMNITSFCYPVGDYDATVVEQVRAAGFISAVTTRWDNNYSDMLTLPRRRVAGGTTAEELGWIITS